MTYLSANTTVSVQEAVVSGSGQFLRLSDKKPGERPATERMTVGQAADIVAGVFGTGTCGNQDQSDAYQVPTDPNTSLNEGAANYLAAKFPGSGGVAELAEKFGVQNLCPATLAPSGKKTLPVYVHASSDAVFEDYRLVSYGSANSGPVIIEEDIELRFEFTRSASLPIYYWIDEEKLKEYFKFPEFYGDIIEWRGNPKNNRGERVDPPAVRIQGGQVLLHGYYSGILIVRRLPIKYHRWMITVTGTALEDGKREYKGRVSAISSAYGLGPVDQQVGESETMQDKAAECPLEDDNPLATDSTGAVVVCSRDSSGELVCSGDDDDPKGRGIFCFIEIKKELIQQCTGDYLRDLPTEYRQVDCPDSVTPTRNSPAALNYNPALPKYYKKVGEVTEEVYSYEGTTRQITDAEYEEVCCHAPVKSWCVPYCREIKSNYYGPVEIEGGRQKYIDQYNGKTVFVPVGTEFGPCGTLKDIFVNPSGSCDSCASAPGLVWAEDNPQIIAPNSSVDLELTGGNYPDLPITWEITAGEGYSFSGGGQTITAGLVVTLDAGAALCGPAGITVTDGCSGAGGSVDPTNKITLNRSSYTLSPGGSLRLTSTGGVVPKTWSTSGPVTIYRGGGTNYTWADVQLDSSACEDGSVTTTDGCGTSATCVIINEVAAITLNRSSYTLSPGGSLRLTSTGGVVPKTRSTSGPVTIYGGGGTNYTWADVQLDSAADVGGSVTTTDGCGTSATCVIINGNS